ncbi:MAG: hypothetical protein AAFS01_00180 [Pseudomonadota bacterium]
MTRQHSTIFAPFANRPALIRGIHLGSNWHLEAAPYWSRDVTASLGVAAHVFSEPVPLLFTISVFGASQAHPRLLTVSSPGHPDVTTQVRDSGKISVLVQSPIHPPDADFSEIAFKLDQIQSPYMAKLSMDERLLGLHVIDVCLAAPALAWPLDIANAETAQTVLGMGWGPVEEGSGSWTIDDHATLKLPGYLRPAAGAKLHVTLHALTRPEGAAPLQVDIRCNDQVATTWHFPSGHDHTLVTLDCPLAAWQDNKDCTLLFDIKGAMSARDAGINADTRLLGVQLRSMSVTPPHR